MRNFFGFFFGFEQKLGSCVFSHWTGALRDHSQVCWRVGGENPGVVEGVVQRQRPGATATTLEEFCAGEFSPTVSEACSELAVLDEFMDHVDEEDRELVSRALSHATADGAGTGRTSESSGSFPKTFGLNFFGVRPEEEELHGEEDGDEDDDDQEDDQHDYEDDTVEDHHDSRVMCDEDSFFRNRLWGGRPITRGNELRRAGRNREDDRSYEQQTLKTQGDGIPILERGGRQMLDLSPAETIDVACEKLNAGDAWATTNQLVAHRIAELVLSEVSSSMRRSGGQQRGSKICGPDKQAIRMGAKLVGRVWSGSESGRVGSES